MIRPRLRLSACLLLLAVLALPGCGDEPVPPPTTVPPVAIELVWRGKEDAPTRVDVPADTPPGFEADGQRAWKLVDLVGEKWRILAHAHLEVIDAEGRRTKIEGAFRDPTIEAWSLRYNRRGEPQLVLLDPRDPFPAHHGRGGNRGRPAGTPDRVRNVARIVVHLDEQALDVQPRPPTPDRKSQEAAMLQLTIDIDGASRTLDAEALVELDPIEVEGDAGKGKRDAWDVRRLVTALAGDAARLVAVHARGGRSLEIPAEQWADAARRPVLRLNRRGQLKFHWSGSDGSPDDGDTLRDVTKLDVVTR